MPTTLTGVAANGTTDPISISAPAAGDTLTSAPLRTLLQKILDTIQNVRAALSAEASARVAGDAALAGKFLIATVANDGSVVYSTVTGVSATHLGTGHYRLSHAGISPAGLGTTIVGGLMVQDTSGARAVLGTWG